MESYQQTHREAPARELYIFHTSREKLDVRERQVGMSRNLATLELIQA